MRIAHNPQTGEYVGLQGGEWKPLRVASNTKGEKVYLDVDGWKPLNVGRAETPDTPKADDSLGVRINRGFSFGTRNLLEGIGDVVSGFGVIPNVTNMFNKAAGIDYEAKNPGEVLADTFGLQKAVTDSDKVLGAALRGGASVIPTIGAGLVPAVRMAAPKVASFLTAAPIEQLVSGAASGAAAEKVRQGGGDPVEQFLAGMAGGMAPSAAKIGGAAASRVVRTTANMGDLLTTKGQKRAAARQLRRVVGMDNVDNVLNQIDNREMPVEGVEPTLAQITLNPRVAVMEKGLESAGIDGADLIAHQTAQREGRQNITEELLTAMENRQAERDAMLAERMADDQKRVDDVYSSVSEHADTLWQDRDARGLPEIVGPQVKERFNSLYGTQKKATKEAYDAVRGDGSATFSVEPLYNSFLEVIPDSRYAPPLPAQINKILRTMQDDVQNGRLVTYSDLQDGVRTPLTDIAHEASHKGERNIARIANDMKRRLDDYIDQAAEYADQPVQPLPGSAAYRDARREAAAITKARVAADSPMWDQVWGHLDADSLFRDFPDAKRELAELHGRGIFARKGQGIPIDELADSLKNQGWLTPDADSSTLVEVLKSRVRGKRNAARALGEVLESTKQFPTGFTDQQKAAYRRAKATRREQGERFEQGQNEAMSLGNVRDAEVMSNYFRTGAVGASAAQDFLRAFSNDATAFAAMRDYVLSRFLRDSIDTKSGKLSAAKMETFLKNYDAALRQFPDIEQDLVNLVAQQVGADEFKSSIAQSAKRMVDEGKQNATFGKTFLKRDQQKKAKLVGRSVDNASAQGLVDRGILSAVEVERLKGLTRSADRAKRAEELAKVHGSPTSQNLMTQDFLANILGDNLDRQGGVVNALLTIPLNAAMSGLSRTFYGDAAQAINRHLVEASINPEYAKELLTMGKSASDTRKALKKLFGIGPYRNLKGAGEILTDTFKAQGNVNARSFFGLLDEDEDEKKKK